MIKLSSMLGDSNQLFRALKTALAVLLVIITLILFALQQMARDNRESPPVPPGDLPVPDTTSKHTSTLFERIEPIHPKWNKPLTIGKTPESDTHQTTDEKTASLSRNSAVIKQRGHKAQMGSRFIKIAFDGEELNPDANEWSCARDLTTGLLWEVKLFNAGISDAEHTYSWYDPAREQPGRAAGGKCFGIACDTYAYIEEMNRLVLCGSASWRMPSFNELDGLIDRNYYNPTINQAFFPHARGAVYWTATELKNNPALVMQIDFFNGMSTAVRKDLSFALRLVSR